MRNAMKEDDFLRILRDEDRKIIFIEDMNYFNLNNGYSFISSYLANSWLIEETRKVRKIFDFSKNGAILNYKDCLDLGLDLISNLDQEGMVGISDKEELFSDMYEFNISDEQRKNEKYNYKIIS